MASDLTTTRLAAEEERRRIVGAHEGLTVDLPLRFWRQEAHFTTPASDLAMATKAAEQGFSAAARLFTRYGVTTSMLSETLDVPGSEIDALLSAEPHAPLVLIDGEDAQALSDEVVLRGRDNAVRIFRTAKWGRSLRFWRPSGLQLSYATDDLFDVLVRAGEGLSPDAYPIDGVIWPKAEQPDELEWLGGVLSAVERELGMPKNRLRMQFLVESGWSVLELPALVRAAMPRLCGIIFGIADHAASLGLPELRNTHPASDHARLAIVHAAGAAGVPAIDAMTLAYPVADKTLDDESNRLRLLERLKVCFDDARHGHQLGMSGKWVGHPAQLFACLLAYRTALSKHRIEHEVARLEAYHAAVAEQKGATMIAGLMTDRANDRHSRLFLRRAVVSGLLDAARAEGLGVITADERASLHAGWAAWQHPLA